MGKVLKETYILPLNYEWEIDSERGAVTVSCMHCWIYQAPMDSSKPWLTGDGNKRKKLLISLYLGDSKCKDTKRNYKML